MAPVVSPPSSQLKSHQAYRKIRDWIRDGRYGAGERLPSEREMASLLGINHLTLRRGLAKLEGEGVILKKPNVGSFVADRTRVTRVALVLPAYLQGNNAGHPWTSLVMAGACTALDPMKFSVSTLFYQRGQLWDDVGEPLANARISGVLLAPDSSVTAEQAGRLAEGGRKVVCLHDVPALASLSLPAVQPDHDMALTQLIHGLVERGHRKVRVAANTHNPTRAVLRATLETALEQTGLGSLEDVVLDLPNPPGSTLTEAFRPMADVLASDDPPTAIVVPDEYAAADLFQSCYRLGVRVPEDLSVAAVMDQTPHAYSVPLTAPNSVEVVRLAAKLATEQLIRVLEDGQVMQRRTLVHNEVVWRDSVRPLTAAAAC